MEADTKAGLAEKNEQKDWLSLQMKKEAMFNVSSLNMTIRMK